MEEELGRSLINKLEARVALFRTQHELTRGIAEMNTAGTRRTTRAHDPTQIRGAMAYGLLITLALCGITRAADVPTKPLWDQTGTHHY